MKDKPLFVIKKNLQKTAQTGITFQSQLNDTIPVSYTHLTLPTKLEV